MVKCPECKLQITAENCQACFLAEHQLRISIEKKYIATLARLDRLYTDVNRIMEGKKG